MHPRGSSLLVAVLPHCTLTPQLPTHRTASPGPSQVFVPLANVVLLVLCCAVVGGFRDTVSLGRAYGLAVITDMITTTCLVTLVGILSAGAGLWMCVVVMRAA